VKRLAFIGIVLAGGLLVGQQVDDPFPLDVIVPVAPVPFHASGNSYLVYELHVTNFDERECRLARLEVVSRPSGSVLATFEERDLPALLKQVGASPKNLTTVEGGRRAVFFLFLTVPGHARLPEEVEHRLTVVSSVGEETINCGRVAIRGTPVVVGPPLRGEGWMALEGPSNTTHHRRGLVPVDGNAHISQRFGTDWARFGVDGKPYSGDGLKNRDHYCYGAEVLAVADGTITTVIDEIPENTPGPDSRAIPMTLDTMGGNTIILDIGGGHFVAYAHLQPGKVRVKRGDIVRRGRVLGLVGNSGNSSGPHLHFHVCDRNSLLGSEGLPNHFKAFEAQVTLGAPSTMHRSELPLQNWVVRFPD
jgi:murein DD-endopeptidase